MPFTSGLPFSSTISVTSDFVIGYDVSDTSQNVTGTTKRWSVSAIPPMIESELGLQNYSDIETVITETSAIWNSYNNSITSIQTSIDTIENDLEQFQLNLLSISSDVSDVNSELTSINSDLVDMSDAITIITSNIDSVENDISSLSAETVDISSKIDSLSSITTELQTDVLDLSIELNELSSYTVSGFDNIYTELSSINSDLVTLSSFAASSITNLITDITELSGVIDQNYDTLVILQNDLSSLSNVVADNYNEFSVIEIVVESLTASMGALDELNSVYAPISGDVINAINSIPPIESEILSHGSSISNLGTVTNGIIDSKGEPNGYASLDGDGRLPLGQRTLRKRISLGTGNTITTDVSFADEFDYTTTGNVTLSNPLGGYHGQLVIWTIRYGGSHSVTLGNKFRTGNSITFTSTNNFFDKLGACYDAIDDKWDIVTFVGAFPV